MKKYLFLFPMLAIVACSPMQGVPPTMYQGNSADILATVAQNCPSIQPGNAFNYFSVTSITPTSVTCTAEELGVYQVLNALGGTRETYASITFTALQNGNVTSVVGSGLRSSRDIVIKMFTLLDAKFQRVGN